MDYQYFEKHPEARTIQQLINNLNEEIEENYFSRITSTMNLDSYGIEILNEDDLSRVLVKVKSKLLLLDIDFDTKSFTVDGLPSDDDENIFSLTDFVPSLLLLVSGKPRKTSAEYDVELEQLEEWSEDEDEKEEEKETIETTFLDSDNALKTSADTDIVPEDISDEYFDNEFDLVGDDEYLDDDDEDWEDDDDDLDDDDDDDDDDEDAGDFEDGIDDIFEMELAEIDDAQVSLRLEVRQQLRLYPHVKINDMLDGEPVSEDEEWEYVNEEVQLEGRNFEDLDDPFTPFEVPITFFGDHFTLCFSPYEITVREGNTMLKIPAATEYHIVFNDLLEFLTDKAKRRASEWRKQQVLARLERK